MKIQYSILGTAGALAFVMAATLTLTSTPAQAREIATRCTAYGCTRIVCNDTGDRCRRLDENRVGYESDYHAPHRYRHWNRPWQTESYRNWRYACDHDADTCYVHRSEYRY